MSTRKPHKPRVPKPAPWQDFEQQVVRLLELKGLRATHDLRLAGRQTDILLTSSDECVGSVLVECKHHEPDSAKLVGVAEVEDFTARVLRLRSSGDVHTGYLVTNTDFTADAKGALLNRPESKFVFLRTLSSLTRTVIDLTGYLSRLSESFTTSLYEPLLVTKRGSTASEPLDTAIDEFLGTSNKSILLLQGDYGTGKTTSCLYLAQKYANRALASGLAGRIPCYVPLKYFNYTGSCSALILKFLADDAHLYNPNYAAFDAINRAGQVLLILDGFDEMARRVTRYVRNESFTALSELCHENSKVIIAGRPGYFPEYTDLIYTLEALSKSPGFRPAAGSRSSSALPPSPPENTLLYSVARLSAEQIRSFLARRIGPAAPDASYLDFIISKIESIYNLAELATRPIFLEMISHSIQKLISQESVNIADLYDEYTKLWFEVDAGKGAFRRLITSEDRFISRLC